MRKGTPYEKGVRFERVLVNNAKKDGNLAFRSAGSHSPVDVFILDEDNKTIYLIQCKHSINKQKKLKGEFDKMTHGYRVVWKVMHKDG
jgi:Holliday junction resolvase